MQHRPHTYLFWIQYLGFRYHGWQKQPNVKTIQGRLERGLRHVLGHEDFMILGAGRTDSGVSCQKGAFELFNIRALELDTFINELNASLPDDIRILNGQKVDLEFNVIQDVMAKEYRYYFAHGHKIHPFAAGNIAWVNQSLDLEPMRRAAELFVGEHDFRRFCTQGKITDNFTRRIYRAEISEESLAYQGGIYPDQVYCFQVKGSGFLMHQVRIMMGALFQVGMGELGVEDIRVALQSQEAVPLSGKVPAHGLVMHEVIFNSDKLGPARI